MSTSRVDDDQPRLPSGMVAKKREDGWLVEMEQPHLTETAAVSAGHFFAKAHFDRGRSHERALWSARCRALAIRADCEPTPWAKGWHPRQVLRFLVADIADRPENAEADLSRREREAAAQALEDVLRESEAACGISLDHLDIVERIKARIDDLRSNVSPGGSKRDNHLEWNGTEWIDDRCGCRYHPDDDNGTHGGGPHVHGCKQHGDALDRARAEVLAGVETSLSALNGEMTSRQRFIHMHGRIMDRLRADLPNAANALKRMLAAAKEEGRCEMHARGVAEGRDAREAEIFAALEVVLAKPSPSGDDFAVMSWSTWKPLLRRAVAGLTRCNDRDHDAIERAPLRAELIALKADVSRMLAEGRTEVFASIRRLTHAAAREAEQRHEFGIAAALDNLAIRIRNADSEGAESLTAVIAVAQHDALVKAAKIASAVATQEQATKSRRMGRGQEALIVAERIREAAARINETPSGKEGAET